MNEAQTDELRECITCGTVQMAVAPFCVFCGREPLTGRRGSPRAGVEAFEALTARAEAEGGHGSLTSEELAHLAFAHAYLRGRGGVALAVYAVTRGRESSGPAPSAGRQAPAAREFGEAFAMARAHLTGLHVTLDELFGRWRGRGDRDEHALRYAGVVAVLHDDLVAYHDAHTDDALREVYTRPRVPAHRAAGRREHPRRGRPRGRRCACRTTVSCSRRCRRGTCAACWAATEVMGGKDSPEGALVVALLPAAWRGWFDLVLAPYSTVLVYAQTDPLAGLEWAEDETAGGVARGTRST